MYCTSLFVMLLALRCRADLFSEDGVLIQAEGETRTIKAVWTVLVVINPSHTAHAGVGRPGTGGHRCGG